MSDSSSARRPIVIAGSVEDEHVEAVAAALRARGIEPVLFDSLRFPTTTRVSLGDSFDEIVIDGRALPLPAAVYVRGLHISPLSYLVDADADMRENWRKTMIVFQEKGEMLLSVVQRWDQLGVPLYNSPTASDTTRKPFQIARLQAAGVPVPRTLWTNDPEAVRSFAAGRRVAYKPMRGGAATKELRQEDLGRLAALANAPVCFQELLPGWNARVFVIDGRIVAAHRIDARELDYRQNEESVTSFAPDPECVAACLDAAEALGLRLTGIDLKVGEDGRLRVLEANPSPMFLGFDRLAGTDVLGCLVEALASHLAPE